MGNGISEIFDQPVEENRFLKQATIQDFSQASSWIQSQDECDIWTGGRVAYPIHQDQMLVAIDWDGAHNYSLVEGTKLLGVGQLLEREDKRLHLARILIEPTERGRGFGRILVKKLVGQGLAQHPRCLSLNVHPENKKAISLYESIGFLPVVNNIESRNGLFTYMERSRI